MLLKPMLAFKLTRHYYSSGSNQRNCSFSKNCPKSIKTLIFWAVFYYFLAHVGPKLIPFSPWDFCFYFNLRTFLIYPRVKQRARINIEIIADLVFANLATEVNQMSKIKISQGKIKEIWYLHYTVSACTFVNNRPFKCCIKIEFPDARGNLFSFFLRIFRNGPTKVISRDRGKLIASSLWSISKF